LGKPSTWVTLTERGVRRARTRLAVEETTVEDESVVSTAVRVLRVSKLFGAVRALRSVTCEFEWGNVTVVRGGNGSGKSTLLGIVAGRGRPTVGQVEYGDGLWYGGAFNRGSVGWVGHESLCYADLSGRENVHLAARLYGLDAHGAYREASERFDLAAFGDRIVRTYSRGQQQRLSVARSLVHRPRLVVFDEPTAGLDAKATAVLVGAVRSEAARGAAIVVATHDEAFANAVADRTIWLEEGRLVTSDAPNAAAGTGIA
jgi:ABC-type multidrug transport system ATPase subunit